MRIKFYLIVLALVAGGLLAFRACDGGQGLEIGVTPELAGRWKTTSPRYADRYIEIDPREIAFGQGEEGESRYPILSVLQSQGPKGLSRYVIRYQLDAGADAEGNLEVLVGSTGLSIPSQPGIRWTLER